MATNKRYRMFIFKDIVFSDGQYNKVSSEEILVYDNKLKHAKQLIKDKYAEIGITATFTRAVYREVELSRQSKVVYPYIRDVFV